MTYENCTRDAYKSATRALKYHEQQTTGLSWARIATWHQRHIVAAMLRRMVQPALVLDIPCGTGILAPVLAKMGAKVIACDISMEMMEVAAVAYPSSSTAFIQADITALPFRSQSFDCVLVLGLMHRIPKDVRVAALAELRRVAKGDMLITYSLDTWLQRQKQRLLGAVRSNHQPAPWPLTLEEITSEFMDGKLRVRDRRNVMAGLSSDRVFAVEATQSSRADRFK